jgi:4-methyl-5(b-hydroxyethyl)-thiazole monophosphate biosynthesis
MTAPRVLVLLAAGCEEIEAVTPIDVLRRAGVTVVAAGLTAGPLVGSRGVRLLPDVTLEECLHDPFDMVVLPGGMGGAAALATDTRVARLLERIKSEERWVAAICAAPALVLEPQGHIAGGPATCHPSLSDRIGSYRDQRVVTTGKVVTSQGAGTALEFSLHLVALLMGEAKAKEVATGMVARE